MGETFAYCEGPLPFAPGTSPFHIKGEFYRNMAQTIEHFDKKTDGKVRQELVADGIADFSGQQFLSSSMYDALPMPRLAMALARALQRDVREITARFAQIGAETQMQGVYKQIFGAITTKNFHLRFPQTIEYLYDFGRVRIEPHEDGNGCSLTRSDMPACMVEWWNCATVCYIRVPLIAHGAKTVDVDWKIETSQLGGTVPLAHTHWEIRWT